MLKYIGFLFALHDLGKCHPLFQQQCEDLDIVIELCKLEKIQKGDQSLYRHESLSASIVQKMLRDDGNSRPLARLWAEVIGVHHQRKHVEPAPVDRRICAFWKDLQQELQRRMRVVFSCSGPCQMGSEQQKIAAVYLLLGLLVLSDWLASGHEWFAHGQDGRCIKEYSEASRQSANKAIKKLGFIKASAGDLKPDFNQVWPNIPREGMRPLQNACESFFREIPPPGLLVIEAPMGEGKTEAAVYAGMQWIASFGLAGMYIALPTAATSNQMYDRISDFLKMQNMQKQIRLLHGMAWLLDEDTPEFVPSEEHSSVLEAAWFRSSRKGLLSPWAVGTVDQSMMAALKVRFGALRLLGLACKVLVIDEVHAYDVYMTVILERLLSWCGALEIPVILLSATLPSSRRCSLINSYTGHKMGQLTTIQPYPLITYANTDGVNIQHNVNDVYMKRRIKLKLWRGGLGKWKEVAQKALSIVANNGCLCIIVNTVREAQELYLCFSHLEINDVKLMLFHGRFPAGERQRIEQECLRAFDKESMTICTDCRPVKAILVATQVVEQSLDLDFDCMISAIAPIDLLLQRSGRLHRHTGRIRPASLRKPQLLVLLPEEDDFGPTENVYDKWILYRTMEVLDQQKYLDIPDDMRQLIETVYNDNEPFSEHPHRQAWDKLCQTRRKHELEARQYLIPAPDFVNIREEHWYDDEEGPNEWFSASTRLSGSTIQVLLIEHDELKRLSVNMNNLTRAEARRLMLGLVALPSWWFDGLMNADGTSPLIKGAGWLRGFKLLGLQDGAYTGFKGSGEKVCLVNDSKLGVIMKRM